VRKQEAESRLGSAGKLELSSEEKRGQIAEEAEGVHRQRLHFRSERGKRPSLQQLNGLGDYLGTAREQELPAESSFCSNAEQFRKDFSGIFRRGGPPC